MKNICVATTILTGLYLSGCNSGNTNNPPAAKQTGPKLESSNSNNNSNHDLNTHNPFPVKSLNLADGSQLKGLDQLQFPSTTVQQVPLLFQLDPVTTATPITINFTVDGGEPGASKPKLDHTSCEFNNNSATPGNVCIINLDISSVVGSYKLHASYNHQPLGFFSLNFVQNAAAELDGEYSIQGTDLAHPDEQCTIEQNQSLTKASIKNGVLVYSTPTSDLTPIAISYRNINAATVCDQANTSNCTKAKFISSFVEDKNNYVIVTRYSWCPLVATYTRLTKTN